MSPCDLDSSLPEWILDHPETEPLLQGLGLDCTCGGRSLAYACQQEGLNPREVLAALRQCLLESADARPDDPSAESRHAPSSSRRLDTGR